jgi:hypothetical protein
LHDNLPARITRIWSRTYRPTVALFFHYPHPDLDADASVTDPRQATRAQAAAALRFARGQKARIEAGQGTYGIELHPGELPAALRSLPAARGAR